MKEKIKKIILSLGADVCGIANIDRFTDTPQGFSPNDIFVDCKSVIVFGIALPKGLMQVDSRLIYGHFNNNSCQQVDTISFRAAKIIENKFGCYAVSIPCDGPYDFWDKNKMEGRGLISMKHAAVLAGVGTLGKSTLLINNRFGNLLTIGAILTNLKLHSDELCKGICIPECKKCIDSCPVSAIKDGNVIQKLCRNNTYDQNSRGFDVVNCNNCRNVCPMGYGDNPNK
ncbi:MAG: epoxyqueuosine reductase [Firmicutes bacterium HGW-Firmicutes-7]|nr:MAG: epoxyqueuosine reductase [Firmicutes bacterium HGW-Firmicutes-7]